MSAVAAGATELPASPGARLRREREARGLTQQQAAERLTLDISVVTALEADDFAALGAPVFAKGHLRRYAAFLELPEDELLDGYEHSKGQPDLPTLVPRSRLEMAPVRGPSRWPFVVGGALAFLAAAGLVAYISANGLRLPGGKRDSAAAAGPTPAASVAPAVASEPGAVGAGSNAATTTAGEATAGAATAVAASGAPASVPPQGQVTLQLRFTADSWVEVYDGTGRAALYDLGKAGTVRTVTAAAPLSVTVGNASAVIVAVNGRPVTPPPLPPGQTVARFGVGPDGALR